MATPADPIAPAAPEVAQLAPPVAPKRGDIGVSGTSNQRGDILSESNSKLIHEQAYGRPGVRDWGEWELIRRTDEAVAKALEFVMAPIRDARVDIEEPDAEKENKDRNAGRGGGAVETTAAAMLQSQIRFIRWNIDRIEPGWPEFLNQSGAGSLMNGFALHEIVWDVVEHPDLPGGKGYWIKKLAERLPNSVYTNGWTENDAGELVSIRQQGPKGTKWVTVELPVEKVILNSWNRNGNNYLGFSAFRAVYHMAKVRRELARIIGLQHQRESLGIPQAIGEKDAVDLTVDQRASLEEWLATCVYHENINIIMPRGWKLEWLFAPTAAKESVIAAFNELGQMILGQVGAQQMALGVHGTGSRAVGQTHAGSANNFVQGVVGNFEAVINGVGERKYTGFIRKLVDANWGPQTQYPRLKLTLKKEQLPTKERVEAMKTAVDAGLLTVNCAVENVTREALGLPPIDEEERDAEHEKKAAAAALLVPQISSDPTATPPASSGRPAVGSKLSRLHLSMMQPFQPRRELRPSERVLDLSAMASFLDKGRERFEEGARPLVVEMITRALPAVKLAMADGDPSDVADVPLDVVRLDAFVREFLDASRAEGYRQVRAEMRRGADAVARARAEGAATFATPAVHLAKEKPPRDSAQGEADSVLDAARKQLVRRMKNRILSDLEMAAVDVDRTDGEHSDIVDRVVSRQIDTGAFRQDAGLVLTKSFNVGRDEFAQERGDQVKSVELSAILDGKQCGPCDALDGSEFDFNSPEHDAHTPPLSSICDGADSCRCVLIYNFNEQADQVVPSEGVE